MTGHSPRLCFFRAALVESQRAHCGSSLFLIEGIGAQPGQVLLLMMRQGLLLTILGIMVGLIAAFGLTRLLSSLLFGVTPVDVVTFSTISFLLMFISLAACYLPARRAMRIDPLTALRYE